MNGYFQAQIQKRKATLINKRECQMLRRDPYLLTTIEILLALAIDMALSF